MSQKRKRPQRARLQPRPFFFGSDQYKNFFRTIHPNYVNFWATMKFLFTLLVRTSLTPDSRMMAVVFFLLTVVLGNHVQAHPHDETELTVPQVVQGVRPSVVTIFTRGVPDHPFQHTPSSSAGSGFVLDLQGHIVTNNHLMNGSKSVVVGLPTGRLTPGRVIAQDFLLDLAIIKITANDLNPALIGQSSTLEIGETVVAIGNPFSLKGGSTVTVGVVSALDRAILAPNGETLYDLIQTDAAINPGNSGGPLVNRSGEIIGVNVAIAPSAQAISYAISMDAIYPHIQSMLAHGTVSRPDLGMILLTLTPSIIESFHLGIDRGVVVAQIEPSHVAAQAGFQIGDVLSTIDRRPIYNLGDFWHFLLRSEVTTPADITVFRKHGPVQLSLPRSHTAPSP